MADAERDSVPSSLPAHDTEEEEDIVNLNGMTPAEIEEFHAFNRLLERAGEEGMREVNRETEELQARGILDASGKLTRSNYR